MNPRSVLLPSWQHTAAQQMSATSPMQTTCLKVNRTTTDTMGLLLPLHARTDNSTLYSSLGYGAYGTLIAAPGATAYASGSVALWKEARKKQIAAGQYKTPAEGWTTRAKREFKLTAKPLTWEKGLLWPVARVGTGETRPQAAPCRLETRVIATPGWCMRHCTRQTCVCICHCRCDSGGQRGHEQSAGRAV